MSTGRFPVDFDMTGYVASVGKDPRARDGFSFSPSASGPSLLGPFIDDHAPSIVRTSEAMAHPYLVPGAIYDSLWTWDAYFTGLGLLPHHQEAFVGSLRNLLDSVQPDGRAPGTVDATGTANFGHLPQPVHAQWAWTCFRLTENETLLRETWDTLVQIRTWNDTTCKSRRDLYVWVDEGGTGIDNDPAIYARPGSTVALVDINCFHYRELLAMSKIARVLGHAHTSAWFDRSERLRDAINTYMWSEERQTYHHLDLAPRTVETFQRVTWEIPVGFQTWACLFPLWTGVATPSQADRLVRTHVLNPDAFLSGYGIRSTSRAEPFYHNEPTANPSNWQGPVWGLSTFLTSYGLARYGYTSEALRVAGRLVQLMDQDLEHNGTIHEYYHAETGTPLFNPGFISWNTLGARILDNIGNRTDPTTL